MKKRHILAVKGCEFQMKMKSVKAVLIFLLLLAGMVTGYLLWSMREPEYEKEGMLVENEVTAYYNMTETGIPAFSVPTNGMNDYVYGAGIALEEIAKRFVRETDRQENRDPSSRTVNLLGVTPLDFGPQKNVETLKENLQKYGWQVMSVWAMGDDLKTLQRSAEADVNLVVSAVGLRVAKILWEKYKIPYVIGTPNEWLAEDISNALERAATRQAEPAVVYLQNRMQQEADITLVGEPVTMGSLAAGIEKRYGRAARVLCPLKECESLLGRNDKVVLGEEAMEEELKNAKIIVADPLYRPICPGDSIFYELPHVAFSGRIYF